MQVDLASLDLVNEMYIRFSRASDLQSVWIDVAHM
jgi:hypothetical protein